jgi:hypothetical protein
MTTSHSTTSSFVRGQNIAEMLLKAATNLPLLPSLAAIKAQGDAAEELGF